MSLIPDRSKLVMKFKLPPLIVWDKERKEQEPELTLTSRLLCHKTSKPMPVTVGVQQCLL